MPDRDVLDQVRLFLPKYLSPERQADLWKDLRQFPKNRTIYSTKNTDSELLQGDGWRGFVAIDFHSLDRKTVSGLVLSNSCDVNSANRRVLTPNITFVPLVKYEIYLDLLKTSGHSDQQLSSMTETIQRQEVTSLMFLPGVPGVFPDSIALFDDVRAHPLDHFKAGERSLLFRLSDFGFYLFLFKLSIHFTRMLEDIER